MQPTPLTPEQPDYPQTLRLSASPPTLTAIGNLRLLQRHMIGLLVSASCPETVRAEVLNQMQHCSADIVILSGFHAPLERECFDLLLTKGQPTIRCVAHGLAALTLTELERQGIERGRHLLLSPFSASIKRADRTRADRRNRLVVAIAHQILIPYAASGSKTEAIAQTVVALNKPLLTLDQADALQEPV